MSVLSEILEKRIIAIIRGADPVLILPIAQALFDGGIRILEITLNAERPEFQIESLTRSLGDKMLIGAGTVMDPAAAKRVIDLGARFIISPHTDPEVIQATRKAGAVSIPGAFTPNEILAAHAYGGDMIKVFPASLGPAYIRDIRAALPPIPLIPTGGIHAGNIRTFQEAGAAAFGIGSSLFSLAESRQEDFLLRLREKAKILVNALGVGSSPATQA